ncbi:MAG: hypothetical protein R2830_08010 [Saprospiraceae bacterium]
MRIAFFVVMLLPLTLCAGVWPQPKGGGFFKLDHTFIIAGNFYDPAGEVQPLRTLGNYTTSFYGEYGITNRFTGIAYLPFWVRNTLNETKGRQSGQIIEPARTNDAFGDVNLGLKYGILTKTPVLLSASITLGLPTGDSDNVDGLLTGDGEFNQLLTLEAGAGLGKGWVSGGIGYNNRTQGFADEFRFGLEAGVKLSKGRLLLIFKLDGIQALNNSNAGVQGNALFSNEVEFLSPQVEAAWKLNEKWGVSYRFGGAVSGQNVLAAPSHSFGVFYQLIQK